MTVSDYTFPGCSKADGDIPDLAPKGQAGDSFTYTCTATITSDTTNTATTTAKAPAGPDVTAHDSADVNVIHPSIAVNKTTSDPTPTVGTTVHFHIKVTNTSPDTSLDHIVITDANAPGCGTESAERCSRRQHRKRDHARGGRVGGYDCELANVPITYTGNTTQACGPTSSTRRSVTRTPCR